jgi:hypothetical protein
MRPYVDRAQKLPPGTPRVANPRSRAGVALFNTVLRVAASPTAGRLGGVASTLFSPPADAVDLPVYGPGPRPGADLSCARTARRR